MNPVIRPRSLFIALSLLLALALWLSLALGPVSLPLLDTLKAALRLLGLAQPGDRHPDRQPRDRYLVSVRRTLLDRRRPQDRAQERILHRRSHLDRRRPQILGLHRRRDRSGREQRNASCGTIAGIKGLHLTCAPGLGLRGGGAQSSGGTCSTMPSCSLVSSIRQASRLCGVTFSENSIVACSISIGSPTLAHQAGSI